MLPRARFTKLLLMFLLCFGVTTIASAQGVIVPGPCRRCPDPQPVTLPRALPIKSIKIDTQISSQVATTHDEQVFRNDTHYTLEGTYFFPIPESASIVEFAIWENGKKLVGEVHDENGWALGGVCGHTGLFGNAEGVGDFARAMLAGQREGDDRIARRDTVRTFVTRSTAAPGSRALGWDTMLPTSSCGTKMSSRAFGHTGFTGTSLWIDPDREIYAVLLTNRVNPTREREGIQDVRRAFHDAVIDEASRCCPTATPTRRSAWAGLGRR